MSRVNIYYRIIQCPRLAFNHEIHYNLTIINNACPGTDYLTDNIHEVEDDSQEGPTQQIPQRCEVGDGAVVRVDCSAPHTVNHHAGQVEQQPNLRGENKTVRVEGGRQGGREGRGYLEDSSCEVEKDEVE